MIGESAGHNLQQINQGDAQVLPSMNLAHLDNAMYRRHKDQEAAKEAKRRANGKNFEDNLAKLKDIDIYEKDQPYFAEDAKKINEWLLKDNNATDIKENGNIEKTMELQRMINEHEQAVNFSKAKKSQIEATRKNLLAQKEAGNEIIAEDEAAFEEHANKMYDPSLYSKGEKPIFSYDTQRIGRTVSPDKMAKEFSEIIGKPQVIKTANADGGTYETEAYSPERIKNAAVQFMSKHENANTMKHHFNKLTEDEKLNYASLDKKGEVKVNGKGEPIYDLVKYAENTFGQNYPTNVKQTPNRKEEDNNYGGGENTKVIDGNEWRYYKDENSGAETVTVSNEKAKGAFSLTMNPSGTPGESPESVTIPANTPITMTKKRGGQYVIRLDKGGKTFEFPYSPQNVGRLKQKYGYNPEALAVDFSGKGTQGTKEVKMAPQTRVEAPKMTQEAWNNKWSSLKKGQSLVGLDGKTYIKK